MPPHPFATGPQFLPAVAQVPGVQLVVILGTPESPASVILMFRPASVSPLVVSLYVTQ
jgi:hypothetical protein